MLLAITISVRGQSVNKSWTLTECINYALEKNISVQQNVLSNETNKVNVEQISASRFPSLNASASQNFSWNRQMDANNKYGAYKSGSSTNLGLNSSVNLYNGFRISNSIKQANLSYEAGRYNVETIKEEVSLNVLDAYLQVLYSEEQLKNTENQIEGTTKQLTLAEERLRLGAISKSDYLQVKSELASENLTLANTRSQLAINRISLMQLMEYPLTDSFKIVHPEFEIPTNITVASADSVFNVALQIKPQIKSSEINKEIAQLDIAMAKAGYLPSLTLNGGLNTGYVSGLGTSYDYQITNKLVPSVGLTLSIPIYQNKQVKASVAKARIGTQTAELSDVNTRNQLRKSIEQACVNVESATIKYQATQEAYNSALESYNVAQEKYTQGIFNSVDFIIQKNNLITAESELLQAKYNLVFSKKTLDFYTGVPLTF
jgi:outer membrane protein